MENSFNEAYMENLKYSMTNYLSCAAFNKKIIFFSFQLSLFYLIYFIRKCNWEHAEKIIFYYLNQKMRFKSRLYINVC